MLAVGASYKADIFKIDFPGRYFPGIFGFFLFLNQFGKLLGLLEGDSDFFFFEINFGSPGY